MFKVILCLATFVVAEITAQCFSTCGCGCNPFNNLPLPLGLLNGLGLNGLNGLNGINGLNGLGLPPQLISQTTNVNNNPGSALGAPLAGTPPSATIPGLPGPIPFCIPIPPCPGTPGTPGTPPSCPACPPCPPPTGGSGGAPDANLLGLLQTLIGVLIKVLGPGALTGALPLPLPLPV